MLLPEESSAATNAISQIGNYLAAGNINKKTQRYNREMYNLQRADSLADWNMQNEYNSPGGQMARLKAAGLNPNLVYGNGADAQSNSMPRSSNVESWNPSLPQFNGGSIMGSYYDVQLKEAQISNMEMQRQLANAQTLSALASADKTKSDTATTQYNLDLAKQLQSTTIEKAQADLKKTQSDTQYTLDQNERQKAMQATTLQKAVEDILSMRAERTKVPGQINLLNQQIENLKTDNRLKQLDENLKKAGIQPGDPAYMRIIAQIAAGIDIDRIKQDIKDAPSNYKKAFSYPAKPYKWGMP